VKVMQLYMSCKQRKSEMSKDLDRLKQENQRLENRSTTVSIDDRMTSTQLISLIFCTLTVVFLLFYNLGRPRQRFHKAAGLLALFLILLSTFVFRYLHSLFTFALPFCLSHGSCKTRSRPETFVFQFSNLSLSNS
jgi:hypothetical protein